jgi:excisionase family DNA binding protein
VPHPTAGRPDRPVELPTLLDIAALAQHLGVNARHIRRLVAERRIPYIKWGHLIRFDPREIAAWIDDYRRRPGRPA